MTLRFRLSFREFIENGTCLEFAGKSTLVSLMHKWARGYRVLFSTSRSYVYLPREPPETLTFFGAPVIVVKQWGMPSFSSLIGTECLTVTE